MGRTVTDSELNALVAERVTGLKNIRSYTGHEDLSRDHICDEGVGAGFVYDRHYSDYGYEVCNVPDYANDIAAAMLILDHFRGKGIGFRLQLSQDCTEWIVCNHDDGLFLAGWDGGNHDLVMWVTADTLPRAICLAALEAVGVEVNEGDNA